MGFDFNKFDREWTEVAREICEQVYNNPEVIPLREAIKSCGFLSLEEKSKFIDICDFTKYQVIYKRYGQEGTEEYKEFTQNWRQWFSQKGVESQKDRGQKSSVDHILFGSTPDPVKFLLHFEEEAKLNGD